MKYRMQDHHKCNESGHGTIFPCVKVCIVSHAFQIKAAQGESQQTFPHSDLYQNK
jgi:hypothetical protein